MTWWFVNWPDVLIGAIVNVLFRPSPLWSVTQVTSRWHRLLFVRHLLHKKMIFSFRGQYERRCVPCHQVGDSPPLRLMVILVLYTFITDDLLNVKMFNVLLCLANTKSKFSTFQVFWFKHQGTNSLLMTVAQFWSGKHWELINGLMKQWLHTIFTFFRKKYLPYMPRI